MSEEIKIRELQKSDAFSIAELSVQLGYQIDESLILKQITSINSNNDHFAFVAVLNTIVIGYIHGFISIRLTSSPFLEIGGLIVRKEYRRNRIASTLIGHLENHVNDYKTIRVRCNVKRQSAHGFYLNQNFIEKKEQKIFERTSDKP
ncbi:putative N-acetyltransferase YhbS [Aquimarina sp. EL_43]|uniref:GNAT family N-acetyltransferase n=1 Tax=unclassified Aquimarina TaxID=2627091 RepID=UPI0018C992AE|nr:MULTISPECIES: GNAT family N-acetyltransferase [unclassified Aquimarina]MBG6132856.1 putative N-acetyltransferase YhbS [Aquimarina sp. EL_35]MBG6153067.1 putative N-acetyltransferase YhbS [Aquimarina sp. EL_32]MBG6171223.1 putative N-acetyltransferase YhbS [Aquimarina sp. EL_43]